MSNAFYNPNTKIWSGRNIEHRYNKKFSVGQAIFDALDNAGEKVMQVKTF